MSQGSGAAERVRSVTVIIDCYNHERYVEAAIQGVLEDDWGDVQREVIVVDDGSPDQTAARARAFEPSVRVIVQKNSGQAQAFNAGCAAAKGDVISFLDGDDLWYRGKLRALVDAFSSRPDCGLVQHPLEAVDSQARVVKPAVSFPPEEFGLQDILDGRDVLVGTSGVSVRRSVFKRLSPVPKDLTTFADEYVSKHALFFSQGRTIQSVLGGLRIHERNSFQGMSWRPDKLENYLAKMALLDRLLDERLREQGKAMSERGRAMRLLDQGTKEILMHAWRGRRGLALGAWSALGAKLPGDPFFSFKRATLLGAVVSPRLYLTLQGAYSRSGWLPAARAKLLRGAA